MGTDVGRAVLIWPVTVTVLMDLPFLVPLHMAFVPFSSFRT
jgi:hypothetical protein